MGAGKSTVGPIVADSLGWEFLDLDDEIARRCGLHPSEIIRGMGLDRFRRVEARVADRALRRDRLVIAAGGGWGARPGRFASLPRGTVSVFLEVTARTALARLDGMLESRPLLESDDPLAAARALIRRRAPRYGQSDITIETEGRLPEEVARAVLDALPLGKPREENQ